MLTALGCDLVQGHHLSKPLGPLELIEWLDRRELRGAID
jgi:EAL domain-containing protein (putative c-di-GMP-specific phosphodiesterase class I)